jgi:hypothetical protein
VSRLADADRELMRQLAEQGFGTRRIAERVGCSRDTVRRQLDPNYREAEAERKRDARESDAGEPDGGGGTLALVMLGAMLAYSVYRRRWRTVGPGDPEADRQPPVGEDGQ